MLQISELLKIAYDESLSDDRPSAGRGSAGRQNSSSARRLLSRSSMRFSGNMPPVVVWNINRRCNMICPHCYSSARLNPDFDGISVSEAFTVIKKLNDYGVKVIIFSGGEPLLRDDHMALIRRAVEMGMTCHLSSNGSLITKEKAEELKSAGITYIGVSIDGLPEYNDSYRGMTNAYDVAMQGARSAREAGLKTGIRITVTQENEPYLFPLLGEVCKRGFSRFYVSHLVYSGRGRGFSNNDLEKDGCRGLMKRLFDRAASFIETGGQVSIVSGGNDADGVFLYLYVKERFGSDRAAVIFDLLKKRGGNSAGEKLINIDYKGGVHPDQFWQTADCGNILDKSLEEIFRSKLMIDLKKRVRFLKGKCSRCAYIDICRGSHRERALSVFGDIWREDPACYLTEEETGQIL